MTATTRTSSWPPAPGAEKAVALALRLAHAEHALQAFTSGQVDAIVDPDGKAYLLRPAQEHLRKNERRLQALLDSAADVITVVNRGGAILSLSHAVSHVLGYEPEELVGTLIFDRVHEEDLARLYCAFFDVIEGFDENDTAQFRHRDRDGSYRLIEATVGKLRGVSPASVVLSLRPVTSPMRECQKPARPSTLYMSPPDEERESMILSHGRRIPLKVAPLGLDFSEPAPG